MAWTGITLQRRLGSPLACAVAALVLTLAPGDAPARAEVPVEVEGGAAIGFINVQRSANGLPSIETVEDDLAEWCPNEAGGAGGSGDRDLSPYLFWDDFVSPWELAPFHEALMYDPLFTSAGEVDATGPYNGVGGVIKAACLGMATERPFPSAPEGFVFYAPGGAQDVPPSFTASEDVTPAERLGLPATTGPNIVAYAISTTSAVRLPWYAAKVSVSLQAADGEVVPDVHSVAAIDSVIIVPPSLRANERYVGKVTVEFVKSESLATAETVEDALSFTTTQQPNPATIKEVKAEADGSGPALTVTVAGNRDPNAALVVTEGTGNAVYPLAGGGGEQQLHVTVTGSSPGLVCLRTYGDDGYQTLGECQGFAVSSSPDDTPSYAAKPTSTQGGQGSDTLRREQLRDLTGCLRAVAAVHGKSLRRHNLLALSCRALTPGVLTIEWYAPRRVGRAHTPRNVTIASARLVLSVPRLAALKMKLNREGLAIVHRVSGRLKLVGKATFVPTGIATISASVPVSIRP